MSGLVVRAVGWDSPESDAARALRMAVFVDEQRVPAELELDEIDPVAFHVACYDGGVAVATGRLFEDPERPNHGRIGRMAVAREARGRGAGRAVLLALVAEGLRRGYEAFVLDAQVHALGFYGRLGFAAFGPEHLDAGIVHRMMQQSADSARRLLG